MEQEDILHLAELARIDLSEAERETLTQNVSDVLGYVSQIDEITAIEAKKEVGVHYNVMREDGNPHEPGVYSDALLEAMPERHGRYLLVKKIIDDKK